MTDSLIACIDHHMERLDDAVYREAEIFANGVDPQRYESFLWFAADRMASAQYHLANVKGIMDRDAQALQEAAARLHNEHSRSVVEGATLTQFRFSNMNSANQYSYELSAFLMDLRSALDFLATVAAFHLRGVEADSIRTLIRLVKKSKTSPTLDAVANHVDWILTFREYRDRVAHRLVIPLKAGFLLEWVGNHHVVNSYPVVVPDKPPAFVPDTREVRAQQLHLDHGMQEGFVIHESKATGSINEGPDELLRYEKWVTPAPGYTLLDVFMTDHLESFEAFFVELVDSLSAFEIQAIG